jgi:stearoyl-CoA desaturase (delta-9 desaturase)
MKLDSTTQSTFSGYSLSRSKIQIENKHLQTLQWRFAFTTLLVPFVGSIVAIGLLGVGVLPIGPVEIGLLVSLYVLTFVGVTVGFHRYFAHKAFETEPVIRIFFLSLVLWLLKAPLSTLYHCQT